MRSASRSSQVSAVISVAPSKVAICPNAALLVLASPLFHFSKNSAMTGDYIMRVFYDILFFRLRANPKIDCQNDPANPGKIKVYDHVKRTNSCDRCCIRKNCFAVFHPSDCGFLGTVVQPMQNGRAYAR